MENKDKEKQLEQLNDNLSIIRLYVDRKMYKNILLKCLEKQPEANSIPKFGKKRLVHKPETADFMCAMNELSEFLYPPVVEEEKPEKKEKYDSATLLSCLEVLFKGQDYESIEKICQMIDEDANDENAARIRKILLTTRNNLTASNVQKD